MQTPRKGSQVTIAIETLSGGTQLSLLHTKELNYPSSAAPAQDHGAC